MIQIGNIRADYPEFASTASFPDSMISYWLQIANLMVNQDRFGPPAPFIETGAVLAAGGAGYAVNDKLALAGGVYTQPAILLVTAVDGGGAITAFSVFNAGQYTVTPTNPVASSDTTGAGSGATFTMTWQSGLYTECDLAIELFTCHNLVLERRAAQEAANGSNPGVAQGPISAKSVGPVSVSYDTASAAVEGMGELNLTIYGQRLIKLIKAFGMGVLTIVGDTSGGPFAFGNFGGAWQGPITQQGINWDN